MSVSGRQARVELASIARLGQVLQRPECDLPSHVCDPSTSALRGGSGQQLHVRGSVDVGKRQHADFQWPHSHCGEL